MAKEYKTLTFDDNEDGRKEAEEQVNFYAKYGWELKSKETIQQGWSFGKTCCLGIIFLPLALLGKKSNTIQIILEREISPKNKKLDAEMAKAELEQTPAPQPMGTGMKVFIGILIFGGIIWFLGGVINKSVPQTQTQQSSAQSATETAKRVPYVALTNGSVNYVLIDPKYVNGSDLQALGQELKNDYASDSLVRLSVYDDKKAVDIRNNVINDQATQADKDFYDAHYVAQYNKNDNTSYNEFAIYQDGSGQKINKIIDY